MSSHSAFRLKRFGKMKTTGDLRSWGNKLLFRSSSVDLQRQNASGNAQKKICAVIQNMAIILRMMMRKKDMETNLTFLVWKKNWRKSSKAHIFQQFLILAGPVARWRKMCQTCQAWGKLLVLMALKKGPRTRWWSSWSGKLARPNFDGWTRAPSAVQLFAAAAPRSRRAATWSSKLSSSWKPATLTRMSAAKKCQNYL